MRRSCAMAESLAAEERDLEVGLEPVASSAAAASGAACDAAGVLAALAEAVDGDDSDSDDEDDAFDYAGLERAQREAGEVTGGAAASSAGAGAAGPKRQRRGGCKESQKRRKRQRRQDVHGAAAAGTARADPGNADAAARCAKEAAMRARGVEGLNNRTLFVTNLSINKVTEQELRDWLGKCGVIRGIRLSRDKATTHLLGYAHVQFETPDSVAKAIQTCDKHELHGRVMRVTKQGQKLEFELPEEIKEDIRSLIREAYEGKNLSCLKDAWRKRHPGQVLDTAKWGFKNFSTAMKTIEGVAIETHADKQLTNLAFFQGSEAHGRFLQEKQRTVAERDEAKRKAAEAGAQ